MYKNLFLCTVLLLTILVSGCSDQRPLEELGFITAAGFDLTTRTEHGKHVQYIKATDVIPRLEEESKKETEIITTLSKSSKQSRIANNLKTEKRLVNGQLRVALFGIEFAKQGLRNQIDTMVRDPAIAERVKLAVVEGTANELLTKEYPTHPRKGQFIRKLLDEGVQEKTIPEVTLYDFTRDIYDDGSDPYVPIIKGVNQSVKIDGVGLFRKDRYITKIPAKYGIVLCMLEGHVNGGDLSIDLSTEKQTKLHEMILLSSIASSRKIKVKSVAGTKRFSVTISIRLSGSVLEYTGNQSLGDVEVQKQLEKKINHYIVGVVDELVHLMQTHNVDTLGLGRYIRNQMSYKEWKQLNWRQIYPNLDVTCTVDSKLKDYGMFR